MERTAAAAFNDSSRLSKELDAVRHVAARLRLDNTDMGESLVALEKEVVEGDEEVRRVTFQCRIMEEMGEAQVKRATAGRLAMATVSAVVQRGLGAVIHRNHAATVRQMEEAHTTALTTALAEATTAHEDYDARGRRAGEDAVRSRRRRNDAADADAAPVAGIADDAVIAEDATRHGRAALSRRDVVPGATPSGAAERARVVPNARVSRSWRECDSWQCVCLAVPRFKQ